MDWYSDHKSTKVSSGATISAVIRHVNDSRHPLLLLLHGYPQNNMMWKEFVPLLPKDWNLFIPDLPGYGNSSKDISPDSSRPFSKRSMGNDIIEAIDKSQELRGGPIVVVGHDRGARVAYRMALDHPSRVVGLSVLDIVPTIYVWNGMGLYNNHSETSRSHHWVFLASPRPLPETLIGHCPDWYYRWTINSWEKNLNPDADWVTDSVRPYTQDSGPARIAAACEDYRAGATFDVDDDREQEIDPAKAPKEVFRVPVLSLASIHLCRRFDVNAIWNSLTTPGRHKFYKIGGENTGHFLVNQEAEETAKQLSDWLTENWS